MSASLEDLQAQYRAFEGLANKFALALSEQFRHLLQKNAIPLGVPIEHRVKSWQSTEEKLKRNALGNLSDLSDLVGLRLILLFKRDVERISDIICHKFTVTEKEDTMARLNEDQFGYQSLHLSLAIPQDWLNVPSFSEFRELRAEIQIRTLAQHIWAGASHHLQYKQESSVPLPVRRSIYRVSALLETVDLELERVLAQRADYLTEIREVPAGGKLNVDLLARVLDGLLPAENKEHHENYSALLVDLTAFGIENVKELEELIRSKRKEILAEDAKIAHRCQLGEHPGDKERFDRGVYFTHVGLVRQALKQQVGEKRWHTYMFPKVRQKRRAASQRSHNMD